MSIRLRGIRKAVTAALKNVAEQFPVLMQGFVGKEMSDRPVTDSFRSGGSDSAFSPDTARNTGDKLRRVTSRLFRSFGIGHPENIFQLAIKVGLIIIRYGTKVPYAGIHAEGGTITQKISITARQRRFFWAMFYETQKPMWKFMALKKGPIIRRITIPARPVLGPAAARFRIEAKPALQGAWRKGLLDAMRGG